ncbi:MAG: hypothetical protein R3B09_09115 [Nannocystaceae bacterium]
MLSVRAMVGVQTALPLALAGSLVVGCSGDDVVGSATATESSSTSGGETTASTTDGGSGSGTMGSTNGTGDSTSSTATSGTTTASTSTSETGTTASTDPTGTTTTASTSTTGVSGTTEDSTTTEGGGTTTDTDGTTTDTGGTTTSTTGTTTDTGGTTDTTGVKCLDGDEDGYGDGCDLGPDCDDADFNNHTPEGCAGCDDQDMDGYWAGCDQYDDNKVGPDCDDNNKFVTVSDVVELCNGIAENCAGEIDPLPAEKMCVGEGDPPPHISQWICDPPSPGVDGCKIGACADHYFDLNTKVPDGCECAGTDYVNALEVCGEGPAGKLGVVNVGDVLGDLPVGTVPILDNGIGNGAEDWYWVEFPEGNRPKNGTIQVSFAVNEGNDYRFQVFRNCGDMAFAGGLATQYGAGAPPGLEWSFRDNHDVPAKSHTVAWPSKVFIRVFRVQHANTCNNYKLVITRPPN